MGGEDWDENYGCMIHGGGELSSDKKGLEHFAVDRVAKYW
jgi:hypothetical protein